MAAAGLWTTPSDLARFAVGLQEAAADKSGKTLSRGMARQMLTDQKNGYGLGVGVEGSGSKLRFGHGGRDEGFDARLVAYAETRSRSRDHDQRQRQLADDLADPRRDRSRVSLARPAREHSLETRGGSGRWRSACGLHWSLRAGEQPDVDLRHRRRAASFTLVDGFPDEEFVADADDRFSGAQRDVQVTFLKDGSGAVNGLMWKEGDRERNAPRIGPLFHHLKPADRSRPGTDSKGHRRAEEPSARDERR